MEGKFVGTIDVSHDRLFSRVLHVSAWGCVVLIAVLSLLPAEDMVRTPLGGHVEHMTAYAGTAALLRLSYPRQGKRIAVAMSMYAGLLELLQNLAPGRHPAVADWFFSSAGALLGIVLIHVTCQVWWRRRAGQA